MNNNIKEIREQKGLERKELSEKTGIHYSKIKDYENKYIKIENVPVGNLDKIAKALECTVDDLIN